MNPQAIFRQMTAQSAADPVVKRIARSQKERPLLLCPRKNPFQIPQSRCIQRNFFHIPAGYHIQNALSGDNQFRAHDKFFRFRLPSARGDTRDINHPFFIHISLSP